MTKRRASEVFRVFRVVVAYWIVSISLVFINKSLLTQSTDTPDAPLFITCFQCFTTAVLCYIIMFMAQLVPDQINFPKIDFSFKTAVDVLPLSVVFVLMVSFNNLCLKYLNVSFYYLARSLTTVFNVIFTYLILKTRTSLYALVCCTVIVLGYGYGVNIEGTLGSLSLLGAIFGICSSVTCALNSIFTSRSLPFVDGSVWRLTFYNNVNAVILFIPCILLVESGHLVGSFWFSPRFWAMMLLSGLFGFAIGYVSTLQIQVTSPLTHNVCGTAKAAAQTVLAVMVYAESKTFSWWMSNLVVLLGSAAYTYVRHREMVTYDDTNKEHEEHPNSNKSHPVSGSKTAVV